MLKKQDIEGILQSRKDKLKFHQQEYKKFLENEFKGIGENATSNNIENAVSYLSRISSNIAKCEGAIEDLKMLVTFYEIAEKQGIDK